MLSKDSDASLQEKQFEEYYRYYLKKKATMKQTQKNLILSFVFLFGARYWHT